MNSINPTDMHLVSRKLIKKRGEHIGSITHIDEAWHPIIQRCETKAMGVPSRVLVSDQCFEAGRMSSVAGIPKRSKSISNVKRLKRTRIHSIKLEILTMC